MEEGKLFGIDIEAWNSMPVMAQIQAIEENTSNTDANIQAILEHLQNEETLPLADNTEFQTLVLEELDKQTELLAAEEVAEEPAEEVAEEPAEEVAEEPAEEVAEEPAEETPDYLALIYAEIQQQNENTLQLTEQLEEIQLQNEITNNADHITSIYGLAVIPGLIVIYALNKLIKPFTSY